MIKKPTTSPTVDFEDEDSKSHSVKATVLNHLFGESIIAARKLEGLEGSGEPRSITNYAQFREKLTTHLNIQPNKLSEESVFLIAQEMQEKIDSLKKTCIVTVN